MRALAVAIMLCAALASTAGAAPARRCDSAKGLTVIAHGVSCKFARKWVKRYVKNRSHPKHYKCTPPSAGSNVKVNCQGDQKPSGDPQYRYYYGIKS